MKQEIWQICPDAGSIVISEAINEVIQKLDLRIKRKEFSGDILSLAFFIDSCKDEYSLHRDLIISKLKNLFGIPPTFSVIGQPPAANEKVRLDVQIITSYPVDTTIRYFSINDEISYTILETNRFCEYFFSGITIVNANKSLQERLYESYLMLESALLSEKLGMNDIVRQWNYLEDIVDFGLCDEGSQQNYQLLNNVRHTFYSKYEFSKGYPAATGIGMNSGGFILECIAIREKTDLEVHPVNNPSQVSAYDYSKNVLIGTKSQGLSTPKFERAKFLAWEEKHYLLHISGTAAIHNEKSLGIDDVEEQTKITLSNIDKLHSTVSKILSAKNISIRESVLSYLRVYIKSKEDYEKVKAICDSYAGENEPVYLIADICRKELLVEIEGIFDLYTK